MQWISERDAADATLSHHALVLEADDPIEPAYVEFWKRILADGCAHATRSRWQSLTVEICERQSEAEMVTHLLRHQHVDTPSGCNE